LTIRNFHVPDDKSIAPAVGLLKRIVTWLLPEPHADQVRPEATLDGGVTRVDGDVTESPVEDLGSNCSLRSDVWLAPPWNPHTVPPGIALFLQRLPVRDVALHWTTGTLMG
jgi:hypothetical protein